MELLNHTKHHIVSVLVLQRFIVVQKVGGDTVFMACQICPQHRRLIQ